MPAYWIARARLRDLTEEGREGLKRYAQIVSDITARHPFERLLPHPSTTEVLEGTTHFDHYWVHKFPSKEAALAFYYSPEYQEALAIRKRYIDTELVIVDGADSVSLP